MRNRLYMGQDLNRWGGEAGRAGVAGRAGRAERAGTAGTAGTDEERAFSEIAYRLARGEQRRFRSAPIFLRTVKRFAHSRFFGTRAFERLFRGLEAVLGFLAPSRGLALVFERRGPLGSLPLLIACALVGCAARR